MENQWGHYGDQLSTDINITDVENSDLSHSFYNQVFYQTIELLMEEYGEAIYHDLALVLRQLTLLKIALCKTTIENLNTYTSPDINFDLELDAYEAIDLFIAYPRCPKYQSNIFTLSTCDWSVRYGQKIRPHLTKLEEAHKRLFWFQSSKSHKYLSQIQMQYFTFSDSENLMTNLNFSTVNQAEKQSLTEEIDNLTSEKFYSERMTRLQQDLCSNMSEEDKRKFQDFITASQRVEDFNFRRSIQSLEKVIDKEIQSYYGQQYRTVLGLTMKYRPLNSNEYIASNSNRVAFAIDFRIY